MQKLDQLRASPSDSQRPPEAIAQTQAVAEAITWLKAHPDAISAAIESRDAQRLLCAD